MVDSTKRVHCLGRYLGTPKVSANLARNAHIDDDKSKTLYFVLNSITLKTKRYAVGIVERDGLSRHVCVCICVYILRRAAVPPGMRVSTARSDSRGTAVSRIKNTFKETQYVG